MLGGNGLGFLLQSPIPGALRTNVRDKMRERVLGSDELQTHTFVGEFPQVRGLDADLPRSEVEHLSTTNPQDRIAGIDPVGAP